MARYLRLVERLTRGWAATGLTVAFFAAAGAVGEAVSGRAGVGLASAWVLFLGTYCALNFWHCRETHCVVTGAGWTVLAVVGLVAVVVPGMSWFRVDAEVAAFLVILGLGYALESVVAARTGRRTLR